MADRNGRLLLELLSISGNDVCSDCGIEKPEWASYNMGIFLCTRCAAVHRYIYLSLFQIFIASIMKPLRVMEDISSFCRLET